jgi:hypothetical protein
MARTPNRPSPKQAARDDDMRNMLSATEDPMSDDSDFPVEIGQAIESDRSTRPRSSKIFGLGAAERAFVSVVLFLIVVIFSVALLLATGRIQL